MSSIEDLIKSLTKDSSSTDELDQERYFQDDYYALIRDAKGLPMYLQCSEEEHEQIRTRLKTPRGNSRCCMWHLLGPPELEGKETPLWDYEKIILAAVEYFPNGLVFEKSRGLGGTELVFYILFTLALSTDLYHNKIAFITTGLNMAAARMHIIRMKRIIEKWYPGALKGMKPTQNWIEVNKVLIIAFPADNVKALRSYTDVFFIFLDEFDFYKPKAQEEIVYVVFPYKLKNKSFLFMNSTPGEYGVNGQYYKFRMDWQALLQELGIRMNQVNPLHLLEFDKHPYLTTIRNSKYDYFFLSLDYKWGVGKIYDPVMIEKEKDKRYFRREFELRYEFGSGNLLDDDAIQRCITDQYNPRSAILGAFRYYGIDPGLHLGSAIGQFHDGILYMMHADEDDNITYESAIDKIFDHAYEFGTINKFGIDASQAQFVSSLKDRYGEKYQKEEIEAQLAYCKEMKIEPWRIMDMVPIPPNIWQKVLAFRVKDWIEDPRGLVKIHPSMTKLISSLQTAYIDESNGKLDKDRTEHTHVFDGFRNIFYFLDK